MRKTDENLQTIVDDELYELSQIQVKRVNEKKGGGNVMNEYIDKIIRFWFGSDNVDVIETRDDFWFGINKQVDQQIKRQFSALVISAYQQDLANWTATAKGSLALLVLLDQFTRNIYRGTGRAFSYDKQARAICLQGIERGHDLQLSSSERVFLLFTARAL